MGRIAADGVIATNNQTKAPKALSPIQPSGKSFEVENERKWNEMGCDVIVVCDVKDDGAYFYFWATGMRPRLWHVL